MTAGKENQYDDGHESAPLRSTARVVEDLLCLLQKRSKALLQTFYYVAQIAIVVQRHFFAPSPISEKFANCFRAVQSLSVIACLQTYVGIAALCSSLQCGTRSAIQKLRQKNPNVAFCFRQLMLAIFTFCTNSGARGPNASAHRRYDKSALCHMWRRKHQRNFTDRSKTSLLRLADEHK